MLTLAPVLSDHAVFARGKEIRVFGRADGKITAHFLGMTRETEAEGDFCLSFPPQKAGGPYEMTVETGKESVTLRDLYVGEVFLFAGQSNMQFKLGEAAHGEEDLAEDGLIRAFHVCQLEGGDAFDERWTPMTRENSLNWSAIAAFVSRLWKKEKDVPVGALCLYQGAAVIQTFLSPASLAPFVFRPEEMHPDHTHELFRLWNPPSLLYEKMVLPTVPYALSGAVWYQGESNTSPAEGARYREMLEALIAEWRSLYRDPALPFVIVRINDFLTPFSEEGWKLVQKGEEEAVRETAGTALVPVSDLGEHELIHPTNKRGVSRRIARELLRLLDGE